jgi:SagB-type dehydrogenase family enzyme
VRQFSQKALELGALSYLLWATGGIQRQERGHAFRTAPSAGALYPIETYLVVNNVSDLDPGIYHYAVQSHHLEQLREGGFGRAIARGALGQRMCVDAQVVWVWTALFQRSRWKYKQRAYRYIYLDAGHMAENLALSATALNLGSCQIGALFDDEINDLLGIDGIAESVIYLSVVGHPR